MKFTAFILATAAATASAQFFGGVNYQPYGVQTPGFGSPFGFGQRPLPYPVAQPGFQQPIAPPVVDPLAWERDCTWINSINFRAALSRATCGVDVCVSKSPNGNGGGYKRTAEGKPALAAVAAADAPHANMDVCGGASSQITPVANAALIPASLINGANICRTATATAAVPPVLTDGMHVWGSVINRAGRVCAVAYTGQDLSQQFPFGRIQSMKRANTANSLSLPSRAMPSHVSQRHEFIEPLNIDAQLQNPITARSTYDNSQYYTNHAPMNSALTLGRYNLDRDALGINAAHTNFPMRQATWTDNGWYGFSHDRFNPGNLDVHFQGAASNYGEACGTNRQDPMCMQKPGGYDYSAGGLPLYDAQGVLRGAIGVAGDNDCASHAIAWKAREQIQMHFTPANTDRMTVGNSIVQQVAGLADLELYTRKTNTIWSHTGAKAEDNVVFEPREFVNFPACYVDVVRNFAATNPTQHGIYSPIK